MPRIILNKQNHTIKVINRKANVKLYRRVNKVSLIQTGRRGPQGIEGPRGITGYSNMTRVKHDDNPNVARPDSIYVEWMGNVAPNNATTVDTWILTP